MNRFMMLALLLVSLPSFAQDATITKISGPVFVRAEGAAKDIAAKGGEELLYGDAVRTGKGGSAHLLIGERGAVLVREIPPSSSRAIPKTRPCASPSGSS